MCTDTYVQAALYGLDGHLYAVHTVQQVLR
jgi:hypothetical protein